MDKLEMISQSTEIREECKGEGHPETIIVVTLNKGTVKITWGCTGRTFSWEVIAFVVNKTYPSMLPPNCVSQYGTTGDTWQHCVEMDDGRVKEWRSGWIANPRGKCRHTQLRWSQPWPSYSSHNSSNKLPTYKKLQMQPIYPWFNVKTIQ